MQERRMHRSNEPTVATSLFLSKLTAEHGLSAIILASEAGDLIGGSELVEGRPTRVTESYGRKLAVIAKHAFEDEERGEPGLWKGKNNESVWSSRVEIGGTPYYLASVGGVEAARRAAVDAMPTCERILAA